MRLAVSGLPVERLASALLEAVQVAVPADGGGLGGIDPATLLFNRLLALSQGFSTNAIHYLHSVYLTDPAWALTLPGMMRAGSSAHAISERLETSWGIPPTVSVTLPAGIHTERYRAIPGPEGGVLRAAFPADGQWVAALELLRFDPARPFQRGDVAFMRLVAPTIGRALRAALDRERALVQVDPSEETPATYGVLVLTPHGRVQFSTPAAERWVRTLREAEHGGERSLPLVVMSVVAGVRAGVPAIVRLPTALGPLRIEASPGNEGNSVAVVLTPERPPRLPRSRPTGPSPYKSGRSLPCWYAVSAIDSWQSDSASARTPSRRTCGTPTRSLVCAVVRNSRRASSVTRTGPASCCRRRQRRASSARIHGFP